ncbi:MAG: heme o synthase [Bacteriovorax sp.]|nr:heme o synthase [Bacteriovorax sp.]
MSKNMRVKNLSLVAIITTFVLIIWGAVVHNTESSLACPDWPLCYNSFFPKMEGAILIEHGHRLLATLVGIFTIGLVVLSFIERKKSVSHKYLFKISCLALFLVIAQGALGGITVIYRLPTIVSTSHLGLSLLFFATLIYIHHQAGSKAICNKERFNNISLETQNYIQSNWKPIIRHGILLSLAFLYMQILLGAFMRHAGAGAACGLGPNNSLLCMDYETQGLTFWPSLAQAQLHMIHRMFAIFVFLVVSFFSIRARHFFKNVKAIRIASFLPFLFISFQVLIGIFTVALNLSVVPTTLHLAGAALSLAALWKLNLLLKDIENSFFLGNKHSFFSDIVDLTKPRLSLLVIVTALVGTLLAPDKIYFFKALLSLFLITLVVLGAATLNCYIEREGDAKMIRTKDRPLPAKRMDPGTALWFGAILLIVSIPTIIIFINALTGILAIIAAALYLYAYTPMKKKSEFAVYVGAIPGALPPVMGWTAVTGKIDFMAVALFLILFIWQLPHFLAISLYHAEDYGAADIKVYPNLKRGLQITKIGIFVFTLMLFGAALLPSFFSHASYIYTRAAFFLSTIFLIYAGLGFFLKPDIALQRQWAKNYFYGSLFYLPLLLGALIFFK